MTTSDDEPIYAEQHDGDLAGTTHAEPLGGDLDGDLDGDFDGDAADPMLAAPRGSARRTLLGILAGLVAAVAGVALWAVIYAQAEREYVGVSVVIGLTVGWLVRVVSRRSDIWLRIVAMVVTAVASVAGTVTGEVAYTAKAYNADFWQLLRDIAPEWLDVLSRRPAMTYAIFAAGVVLAYLAASPQKPKQPKHKGAAADAAPAWAADEELDATGDGADREEPPPPPAG